MTRLVQFANNAVSRLAANITAAATSISLTPGEGAKFPSLSAGQYFMGTLVKSDGTVEVVKVTARSGDTLTVTRAAESVGGTQTAYAFSAGDRFEHRLTSGVLASELDRLDAAAIMAAINKSANYTLTAADVASLVRCTTTSGAVTITLPQISTLGIDYDIVISKVTSDANVVAVTPSGSDTINDAALYNLTTQWQSVWLIADRSTNTWTAINSGSGVVNAVVDQFTGSGTAGPFTLSANPGSKNNLAVFVGGVYQQKATFTLSGTSLTMGGTVASGVGIEAVYTTPLAIGTPSDGAVTTQKLADNAVTVDKIADAELKTLAGMSSGRSTFLASEQPFGMRNRIINGDMRIDQRNGGASVTPTAATYSADRWLAYCNVASKYSIQQNAGAVTPPTGFNKYLGVTSLSAYSVAAGDRFFLAQVIEGFNAADLAWGTAAAQAVTISFWVRSSLTGTFGGAVTEYSGTRAYPFAYAVNAANTWEQKTITIPGDTAGTWNSTNSGWGQVSFGLGCGSTYSGTAGAWAAANYNSATGAVSIVGTNGATFYITGVQLEAGSVATPFERRPYGTELALCQRYYEASTTPGSGILLFSGNVSNGANYYHSNKFSVAKRANPTFTFTDTGSLSFPVGAPALNATTTTEFSTTKTANATNVGYFQYSFAASAEL